ncbi:MAG: hypothetical protein JRN20_05045 [Nitrososphaerota archaeon]|nr:hypothetical protein [Nitrososphaerota archaeon]MDG6923341.1 hypothetical protein [Nitrososphaerota archaeon]
MNDTISIVLVVHIVASAVWVGAGIFTEFILNPTLKTQEKIFQASILSKNATRVAILMVWVALIALSLSGLALMWLENWLSLTFLFGSQSGLALLLGMILTLGGIVNGLVITLVLIPRKSSKVPIALRTNLSLAVAIVLIMVLFYEFISTSNAVLVSSLSFICGNIL